MDIKEYINFTKQERTGIVLFLCSSIIVILIAKMWPKPSSFPVKDLNQYYLPIDSLNSKDESRDDYDDDFEFSNYGFQKNKVFQKFSFNPNLLSGDSLLLLGFSKYGVKSLLNYRSKGGRILNASKFKTIFGIDSVLVNDLSAFINYGEVKDATGAFQKHIMAETQPKEFKTSDLNTADSIELVSIKGIGPYTVKKILFYRKKLGGFLTTSQLVEFNIMSDSILQNVALNLTANPEKITKININTADFKTFIRHPYFTAEAINAILKYRKQHGDFQDVRHISRIKALNEEIGNRILPYLTVE